jgi:hypothetical protein
VLLQSVIVEETGIILGAGASTFSKHLKVQSHSLEASPPQHLRSQESNIQPHQDSSRKRRAIITRELSSKRTIRERMVLLLVVSLPLATLLWALLTAVYQGLPPMYTSSTHRATPTPTPAGTFQWFA